MELQSGPRTFFFGLIIIVAVQMNLALLEAELQNFRQIGESSIGDFTQLRVRKNKNGTRVLVGTFAYFIPMDNTIETEGNMYRKSGGEYRLLPYRIPRQKFCDFFASENFFFPEITLHSDLPPQGTCPYENRTYHLNDFAPVLDAIPEVILDDNAEISLEIRFYRKLQKLLTIRFYFMIIKI